MMLGIAFHQPIGKAVYAAARRRGLLLRPGLDWDGVAPPLCTTMDEADEIAGIIEGAIGDVVGS
jgi:adenosylmethionine-8-amino-7-oxononanoate aminotransferase